jgi:outer membrane lipopolysaccharide assembly protein LptE/RlpB
MKRRREMKAALIVSLALVTSGCGYALAGRGSFLPDYIRVVGIPQIENRSTYQQVELVLTEKIRTEFIGRGKYTVLPEASGSDAVLTGEITGISAQPVGFNENQLASRYLFTMTMKVQLTDARTNMVLWSNDAMTFREESELTSRGTIVLQGTDFIDQERSSFDRIATDVARTVVTAILEAF